MKGALTILAYDPGFADTGWARLSVVRGPTGIHLTPLGMGCTTTQKAKGTVLVETDRLRRAGLQADQFRQQMDLVTPNCIVLETPSHVRSSKVMFVQGITYGVIVSLARDRGIPYILSDAQNTKLLVAGFRTASKKDVQDALDARFKMSLSTEFLGGVNAGRWEHPYDALAAAVSALESDLLKVLLTQLPVMEMPA